MTIVEFLRARIDEDEADARDDSDSWRLGDYCRHDPDRALRKVAAERAIVALAILPEHQSFTSPWVDALLALASVYADHPDYREEWKP